MSLKKYLFECLTHRHGFLLKCCSEVYNKYQICTLNLAYHGKLNKQFICIQTTFFFVS